MQDMVLSTHYPGGSNVQRSSFFSDDRGIISVYRVTSRLVIPNAGHNALSALGSRWLLGNQEVSTCPSSLSRGIARNNRRE